MKMLDYDDESLTLFFEKANFSLNDVINLFK